MVYFLQYERCRDSMSLTANLPDLFELIRLEYKYYCKETRNKR